MEIIEHELTLILNKVQNKYKTRENQMILEMKNLNDTNVWLEKQLRDFEIENKKLLLKKMNMQQV